MEMEAIPAKQNRNKEGVLDDESVTGKSWQHYETGR